MDIFGEADDDCKIIEFICKNNVPIPYIKPEPIDGYEGTPQVTSSSSDMGTATPNVTSSSNAIASTSSNNIFSPPVSQNSSCIVSNPNIKLLKVSDIKLEPDDGYEGTLNSSSCEVGTATKNNQNSPSNDIPSSSSNNIFSPSVMPNFNSILANSNRKLRKVPNITSFQKNTQEKRTPSIADSCRKTLEIPFPQNNTTTNTVKRKRGRPPGQKNKHPPKKLRKNSRNESKAWQYGNQVFDNTGMNFPQNYPPYLSGYNGMYNYMTVAPTVKPRRKYTRRATKERIETGTTSQDPNPSSNTNIVTAQQTSSLLTAQQTSSLLTAQQTSSLVTAQQNSSLVTAQQTSCLSNSTTSNGNEAMAVSISHGSSPNSNSTKCLDAARECVAFKPTEACSLNSLQSISNNIFGNTITSSDDEDEATVYQIKTHAQSNAIMYSSNILNECLGGMSGSKSKENSAANPENVNLESNVFSLNSDTLSSELETYNIDDSQILPSVNSLADPAVEENENPQFPENELELAEHFESPATPLDTIQVSNGLIFPDSRDWGNFDCLFYTPDNMHYYAFNPRNAIINLQNELQYNALQTYIDDFKLLILEIRGCDTFGYEKHMRSSNDKCFECNNFTLNYEEIGIGDAEKILKLSKDSENAAVSFYISSLYSGTDQQIRSSISQNETPSQQVSAQASPCCRLLGICRLSFAETIVCVKNDTKLKDLIAKEIQTYNKNISPTEPSTQNDITSNAVGVEYSQTFEFNPANIKVEPIESEESQTISHQEPLFSETISANGFSDNLNHVEPNPSAFEDPDITFLDEIQIYNTYPPGVSNYPPQVKIENTWQDQQFQQPYNVDTSNQLYTSEYQPSLYNVAIEEKVVLENRSSYYSYYNNTSFLAPASYRQHINNSTRENYCGSIRSMSSHNAVQENYSSEINRHLGYQNGSNLSTNYAPQYQVPLSSPYQPALPYASGNPINDASLNRNYTDLPCSQETVYRSRFTTNFTGTASTSNDAENFVHQSYTPQQTTIQNIGPNYTFPSQAQTSCRRLQNLVNSIDKPNSRTRKDLKHSAVINQRPSLARNGRVFDEMSSSLSSSRRAPRTEINPAFRTYSGGNIINYDSYHSTPCSSRTADTPQSPLDLSTSQFYPNHYSYPNPITNQYTYDSTVNQPQNGENTRHSFLEVTRPGCQTGPGEQIDSSNSYMENVPLEPKEFKEDNYNISENSYYSHSQDSQYELSPVETSQNISPEESTNETSRTQPVVLPKSMKKSSNIPPKKHRVSEKSFPSANFEDRKLKDTVLGQWYENDKKPKAETRIMLATKTGLSPTQVNNWFKNRRQRAKKEAKESSMDFAISRCSEPSMPIFPTTTTRD